MCCFGDTSLLLLLSLILSLLSSFILHGLPLHGGKFSGCRCRPCCSLLTFFICKKLLLLLPSLTHFVVFFPPQTKTSVGFHFAWPAIAWWLVFWLLLLAPLLLFAVFYLQKAAVAVTVTHSFCCIFPAADQNKCWLSFCVACPCMVVSFLAAIAGPVSSC